MAGKLANRWLVPLWQLVSLLAIWSLCFSGSVVAEERETSSVEISVFNPPFPKGPFVSRPDVVALLDRVSPDGDCRKSDPLAFVCLIQELAGSDAQSPTGGLFNPFNLQVASNIRETIERDLEEFWSPMQHLNNS